MFRKRKTTQKANAKRKTVSIIEEEYTTNAKTLTLEELREEQELRRKRIRNTAANEKETAATTTTSSTKPDMLSGNQFTGASIDETEDLHRRRKEAYVASKLSKQLVVPSKEITETTTTCAEEKRKLHVPLSWGAGIAEVELPPATKDESQKMIELAKEVAAGVAARNASSSAAAI